MWGGQTGHHALAAEETSSSGSVKDYRSDLKTVTEADLIHKHNVDPNKAEKKARDIQFTVSLLEQHEPFPGHRPCRDAFWIFPFLGICALVFGGAAIFLSSATQELSSILESSEASQPTSGPTSSSSSSDVSKMITPIGLAAVVSICSSFVGSLAFMWMAMTCTSCVVWTSLLLSPCIMIAVGLAFLAGGVGILGMIFLALGGCMLFCTWFCWRSYIPFTIRVLETVSQVMISHPGLTAVSIFGVVLQTVWFVCTCISMGGAYKALAAPAQDSQSGKEAGGVDYVWLFFFGFFLYSGMSVCQFTCDVTYAGVFGRWYFRETENSLMQSFKVAWTTSFGSVCFGSMAIAFIRALDLVVTTARRQAQEEGNIVTCIILLIVECFVGCLGDLLEYVTEWAMVQCGIRGVGLLDAGRILGNLVLCSNAGMILADLLLGSVTSCGVLFCAAIGGVSGGFAGLTFGPHGSTTWAISGVIGLVLGSIMGSAALNPISTGTKTVISLWAEDPNPMLEMDPDMHREFESKIQSKM